MSNEEKKFIEQYFKLDKNLQFEVRKRMQIIYALQERDFLVSVILNNFVSKTEKEMLLNMVRDNADKIHSLLGYKNWELISDSKLNKLIIEYFNEHPELQKQEENNLPF